MRAPGLTPEAKRRILQLHFLSRLNRLPEIVRLPLRRGAIWLDPREVADWGSFSHVFLRDDYRTHLRGHSVLDLGAHRGMFLAYALENGAERVLALEPGEENFGWVERVAATYRDTGAKAEARQAAVAAHDGEAVLHVSRQSLSNSLIDRTDIPQTGIATVPTHSLATLLDQVPAAAETTTVKMDVEGAECEVLLQAEEATLRRFDTLLLETHDFAPCPAEAIESRLTQAGFRVEYKHGPAGRTNWQFRRPQSA